MSKERLLQRVLSAAFGGILLSQACASENQAMLRPGSVSGELKAVHVFAKRDGDVTRFFVENRELCEITMTFDFSVVNLKSEVQFPHTATFAAGEVTEAFSLSPASAGCKWEYSYTNYFKLGDYCAKHDDGVVYQLPYTPGKQFKVTQSFNGSFSHKGSNKYAIDWKMPEGTLVCAARGGLVVKTKQDSNTGGPSMKYDKHNNYVLIRHDDGTLGHYCHLQKGGVMVNAGERVSAGQAIARSGNTGFSSGPHLHFCVFQTRSGKQRESVPISFQVAGGGQTVLTTGVSYRAVEVSVATAAKAGQEDNQQRRGGAQL